MDLLVVIEGHNPRVMRLAGHASGRFIHSNMIAAGIGWQYWQK